MVNIVEQSSRRHAQYYKVVFEIYYNLCVFAQYPTVEDIFGGYCSRVDQEIINLQARIYPDDIYDGRPGSTPNISKKFIPDSMIGHLHEHIGMPTDITYEIIIEILDDHKMFYCHEREFRNATIEEVW